MNEIPEIGDFLRGLPGFDKLGDALVANCARHIEIAYYRQGQDILTIGSENRRLNIVRSGAIELRNEADEVMARLAEGDCFGFPSLMNSAPARNHSIALEDSLIYHLDGSAFERARLENRDFDTWFIRALSDRLTLHVPVQTHRGAAGRTDQHHARQIPACFPAARQLHGRHR